MKKLIINISFLLLGIIANCQPSENFKKVKSLEGITEYEYTPNGLSVLLMQDKSAPVVTVQVVYHVGSTNEVSGTTGATHLLEHLMFKGTPKFNKKKGTAIFPTLQNVGARMNATTWYDRTNYHETIPSDKLELAIEIEADRMRNSLLLAEDKQDEMTVVRNEFERNMNSPSTLLQGQIWSVAYLANPYHHSTIGWKSDIENVPIEKLRDFYDTYYWPNNATLTLVGDFEKDDVFKLIDKYFGKIPSSPNEIPEPYTSEPEQLGPRRVVVKRPGQTGLINKSFKIPGKLDDDYPALDILSELLASGPSSLMQKYFVDNGLALDAGARAQAFKNAGLFSLSLEYEKDKDPQDMDELLGEFIDSLKTISFDQADIDRIIARNKSQNILYRDGSSIISAILNEAIASGDWTSFVTDIQRLEKVTSADVESVIDTYFNENKSTTGYFIPENGTPAAENSTPSNNSGKQFFRQPSSGTTNLVPTVNYESTRSSGRKSDIERRTVGGIDLITLKTSAKEFISVFGSMSLGDYQQNGKNQLLPSMAMAMLSKGTLKNDKEEFAKKLDNYGVYFNSYASDRHIYFSFKCLTKDLSEVFALFAEEIKDPLYDKNEFELLRKQWKGSISQELDDPETQANIALLQNIYKPGHPNYPLDTDRKLELLDKMKIDGLKKFHDKYFGTKSFRLVIVGDVNRDLLEKEISKNFDQWDNGVEPVAYDGDDTLVVNHIDSTHKNIFIPEKTSAQLVIGEYTGLKEKDEDFLPFYLANSALGSGFSGRLMMTVRDEEGLTYGIGSTHSGDDYTGGYWKVSGTFNPELINQGLNSTMREIKKWYQEGISQKEMNNIKSYLTGSYKIGLATSNGLAYNILSYVNKGYDPDYIYEYPEELNAPTLKEINNAIREYLNPEELIIVKSGTLKEESSNN